MKFRILLYITGSTLLGCNHYKHTKDNGNELFQKQEHRNNEKIVLDSTVLDSISFRHGSDQVIQSGWYEDGLQIITGMLEGKYPLNFKHAVFVTESAYLNGKLDYDYFEKSIERLLIYSGLFERENQYSFDYSHDDREAMLAHASIYRVLMDTLVINLYGDTIIHHPIQYNFNDFKGEKDWKSTFVSTLLESGSGNCASMSYLYKILADEKGVETHLAIAPNHIYVKSYSKKYGMFNTELTNGSFPSDAWIMASGYISLLSIQNGVYMEALSEKQMITLCLFDLAKGYEKKYGIRDGNFILRCCDLILKHYPNYINAKLLKLKVIRELNRKNEILPEEEALATEIYESGYRKMPDKVYQLWLKSIRSESDEKSINSRTFNTLIIKE